MSEVPGEQVGLKRLGRYELLELLGRGGMAEVYKARLPGALGFDKRVAVKRILPEARHNTEYVGMFVREARLCSRMMHPNLIQVFEFAETDGELFLAMELVEGSDLRKVMTAHRQLGKPIPLEFVALMALGVLRGLDAAHRLTDENGQHLGVVHRDLSPANVLLSYDGAIKVADFGVAHQGEPNDGDGNTVKGKLQYMAPEQLLTGAVDERVDVFAAGCVLYEMLSGTPVYAFGQTPEIIQKVAKGIYVPVETWVPGIAPELVAVVRRALAADRAERYSDCAVFANDLARLIQQGTLPQATTEDLGLYLQVLLPKQPFRAELSYTPSVQDEAVPILTGTMSLDEQLAEAQQALKYSGAVTSEDTGPVPPPAIDFPLIRPRTNAAHAQPHAVVPTPAGTAVSQPPRAPGDRSEPRRPSTASASELDNMLRAYLDESEPEAAAKDEPAPDKKSWLRWRR